jgi:hypothetical protein
MPFIATHIAPNGLSCCLCLCWGGVLGGGQVTVTDNGGLRATTQLTIFVINVDEPPFFMESPPILRTIREMPEVAVGDLVLALANSAMLPTSIDVKDPEPGAVTITIADGRHRAAFNLTTPVYVAGIRTTQVMLSVANTSVLDYETLFPDYVVRLVLTAVDLGGHRVNSSLVRAAPACPAAVPAVSHTLLGTFTLFSVCPTPRCCL